MKNLIPLTAFAALAATGFSNGQTAAYSSVSGYYQFDGKAGGNIFVPAVVNPSVFAGQITGSSSSTLTLAPSALTPSAFDSGETFATHYVEITSGSNAGTVIDIESNTDQVVTLTSDISGLNLEGTESIQIRPHVTLKSALAGSEGSLASYTDNATFYSSDGTFVTYYYGADGSTGWSSDFVNPDGNNRPIPPGTGFILNLLSAQALTITGEVKEDPTVVQIFPNVVNLVGPINPLVGTSVSLNDAGFEDLAAYTDSITVYQPGALTQFVTYYPLGDGTLSSDFVSATTDEMANTTGAFVIPAIPSAVKLQPGFSIIE